MKIENPLADRDLLGGRHQLTGRSRQVADGDYFDPGVSRRIVVLLTDGESALI